MVAGGGSMTCICSGHGTFGLDTRGLANLLQHTLRSVSQTAQPTSHVTKAIVPEAQRKEGH